MTPHSPPGLTPALRRRWATCLLGVATAALLGGCATLSEEECKTADWGRLGHQDGAAGHPQSRLAEHAEACAKVGIRPMADLWRAGWDQGIWLYCTPQVGWREGLAGHGYAGVCRGRNEEAFVQAHQAGSELHQLQSRIDNLGQEQQRLERQLRDAPNGDTRRRLRERLRGLDHELGQLRMTLGMRQLNAPRY